MPLWIFALAPPRVPRRFRGWGWPACSRPARQSRGHLTRQEFEHAHPARQEVQARVAGESDRPGHAGDVHGADLRFIGMPVGGLCTGTLYLAGDGRLWLWNIFNQEVEGSTRRR